ncbi:MAG: glycosyl transferase group 1, partial [Pseudomonadota bacterium]
PSKVTEMAAAGMLVLSTDISDVRKVLGDGARYLERDDAALLVERLAEIVTRRTAASESAASGTSSIADICAPQRAGKLLADFLFPEPG